MKLFIPKDYFFDNPKPPRLFLCTTGKKIIQELQSYDESLDGKWGSYSEASFSIDRQYVDVLTGEVKVHPTFDKAEGLRKVYMENIGYFVIQDPDATYGEKDSKTLSCFSSEYETANKYLENFRVNTGELDSKEVIYLESIYGYNYSIDSDNLYKLASGAFDPYEKYYIKEYTDNDSYTYQQVKIDDASEYADYDGETVATTLYVQSYPNVRFYWPTKQELSLVHIIFEKIPGWKIGNVDVNLWRKERTFDEDRIAVYDFLMNEIQDTFKCVVEWDTITNTVNFYEEAEDGITEDNTVQTRWETDVFISRDNLANEININYSTDDIKTKLKVSGADDLDIREVNLGQNYIMNLSYYHNLDWMEQDVFERYDDYLKTVDEYTPKYTEAMQNWVGAYNKWNDLMNAVPAEGNVVLVGDEFKKLYCVYGPIDTAYLPQTVTDDDLDTLIVDDLYSIEDHNVVIDKTKLKDQATFSVQGYRFIYIKTDNNFKCLEYMATYNERILVGPSDNPKEGKLSLYHVIDDTEGNKSDNILLKLKNSNSDIATIRIYNAGTKTSPEYIIQSVVMSATSGIAEKAKEYTVSQWVKGELTAKFMGLDGYSVQYIGTMGAYFVLAKDETQEATLEEYGVNLLKEKHETYVTIFQTQTEAMFSQEKYQCIVQNEEPDGDYEVGTRWLDTNSSPVVLKEYNGTQWTTISAEVQESDQANYENYQRYIDNYEKMVAVQNVLVKKEAQATYMGAGYSVANRSIDINLYTRTIDDNKDGVIDEKDFLRYNGQTLEGDMERAAEAHFGLKPTRMSMDQNTPIYYFTISSDPIIYSRNTNDFNESTQYYIKITEDSGAFIYQEVIIEDQKAFDSYDDLYVISSGNVYAVYLNGTIPYVAYANSRGVYDSIKNWITKQTDFENFFTEDQWIRLSPFIREDEFSDSNFLLTGYESEESRLEICKELFESANKELNTLCQPSLEFSMEMANILALPEFQSLIDQFQLGNFVRVYIRDGYVKRARLLEVHLNFSDLSDFSCNFGNLVTTKTEIDKHAELLSQAVTAGKQVATSAGDWQRAVDKSSKLEEEIANGLQNSALEVGRAFGQSIVWDSSGIWGRKLVDGTTDQYEDEQFRIINNKLVFSNDGFKTSKSVMGQFVVKDDNGNDISRWGLLAEAMVGGYIEGSEIRGGNLRIGDGSNNYFQVSESGDVSIVQAGKEKYASVDAIKVIDDAYRYQIVLSYDKSTIFSNTEQDCTITCTVYSYGDNITDKVIASGGSFSWIRVSSNPTKDTEWNAAHIQTGANSNKVKLEVDDVEGNSHFSCSVDFDETKINS